MVHFELNWVLTWSKCICSVDNLSIYDFPSFKGCALKIPAYADTFLTRYLLFDKAACCRIPNRAYTSIKSFDRLEDNMIHRICSVVSPIQSDVHKN